MRKSNRDKKIKFVILVIAILVVIIFPVNQGFQVTCSDENNKGSIKLSSEPSQNIEWKGWWIGSRKVTVCNFGEGVIAKLKFREEIAGRYQIRVRRDRPFLPDEDIETIEFDYNGGIHDYYLSFIPPESSDDEKRYHIDISREENNDWKEIWTMPNYFPPRLRVFKIIPDWDYYHSYAEIEQGLFSLEFSSNIADVRNIGYSVHGRPIWAIKISDDPQFEDVNEPDILFVGLHHAREWISAEVPFYLATELVKKYTSDAKIKTLVDNSEIWIIPVLNPDGFEYTQDAIWDPEIKKRNPIAEPEYGYWSRWWRKNRADNGDGTHGVDLNRNYGHSLWGTTTIGYFAGIPMQVTSSGVSSTDVYWGPSPFSEPETVAIKNLILNENMNFKTVLSYHSYSQKIMYPWGISNDPTVDSNIMKILAEEMSAQIKSVHGKDYDAIQGSSLYATSGDLTDWVYEAKGIPAFTTELRPDWWDLLNQFALPEKEIIDTCEENYPAALYLIDWVVKSEGGFMDFEDGFDGAPIRSTIPGMTFTTTQGYDWIYGDIRTDRYNVNPYGSRAYECNGNIFAWLGPNQGLGKIDFRGATTRSVSMLTSTSFGTHLDAYDTSGTLIDSDFAEGNINTWTLSEISVSGSNIAYVIVYDTGNYWLIDDLRVKDLLRETNAFQSPDSSSVAQTLETINEGETSEYEFYNDQLQILKILVNWAGSQLRVQIFDPNGDLYEEIISEQPPIRVVIPEAYPGMWKVVVTAIDIPFNDYPFAIDVASTPIPPDLEPPLIVMETPMQNQALQDGVSLSALVIDPSGVDWVKFSIREPNGEFGKLIDPVFESLYCTGEEENRWQLEFDTTMLPDGYYTLLAEAGDAYGNEIMIKVHFSIRNWVTLELLPASESIKAGRTMPVKFSLRVIESVDPEQPFVYNEELTIKIYDIIDLENPKQISWFGTTSRDYRIDSVSEKYITNFKTSKIRTIYIVEIWRRDMLIGTFEFETVK